MAADRYVVLPLAMVMGAAHNDLASAEAMAGKKVEDDGRRYVVVKLVCEVSPRLAPNVEVVRYGASEVANG